MFVTILFGILDGATREFRFVRAGHDLPLLLDEHRRPIELPLGAGQSLGILQSPELEEQNLTLPPGGLMLLYTDGVTEAADGGGNQFGIEGLCATLKAAGTQGKSAQATCETIRDAVRTHTLTPTPQDDLTLLAVRVQ
jgi:sigma-B regulation protein RsbU (phosphoserine phosphatase)